jgi:hypothetical protein
MNSIKTQHSNALKRAFGIGINIIANSINIILAVIFQWEFSVVVVCLYIQNFILMSFISLRIYRLMGKNYIKLDSRQKAWSPEYSSPVGMTVMLWLAFALIHFLYFLALSDVKAFSLAMTATNASLILLSCGGYFLYQCYGFFWLKPNYNIKRFNINGESQPVIMVNSNQLFKSSWLLIIHFSPLFFVVFMLNQSATIWLPALLVIVLSLELVAQLIEHDTTKHKM